MKSVINEAKVSIRFKTEDYSWEEYSLGAVVDERESGKQVLRELKLQINETFGGVKAPAAAEETEEKPAKEEKKTKEKKNAKPTKSSAADDEGNDEEDTSEEDSGDDVESDQDDETSDVENDDDSDDSSDESDEGGEEDGGEENEDDAEEEQSSAKSSKKPEGKKSRKAKPQNYNRAIEQHKEIFSAVVRSIDQYWKKSDSAKALAKAASAKLEGKPFLDENGDVLEEFSSAVSKLMKSKK